MKPITIPTREKCSSRTSWGLFHFKATLLVVMFFVILPKISLGQGGCPTDGTWYGPYTVSVQISGTSCEAYVTFCYQPPPTDVWVGTFQIESIVPDPNTDCTSLTNQQIISGAISTFKNNLPGQLADYVPPCGQGHTLVLSTTVSDCWELNLVDFFGWFQIPMFTPCSGYSYCVEQCLYCSQNGSITVSDCSSYEQNYGNCNQIDGTWNFGECYDLGPCVGDQ